MNNYMLVHDGDGRWGVKKKRMNIFELNPDRVRVLYDKRISVNQFQKYEYTSENFIIFKPLTRIEKYVLLKLIRDFNGVYYGNALDNTKKTRSALYRLAKKGYVSVAGEKPNCIFYVNMYKNQSKELIG